MTSLQIRDLPETLYSALQAESRRQNRSMSQQAIVLIASSLNVDLNRREFRKALLEQAAKKPLEGKKVKSPVDLVREDRDR